MKKINHLTLAILLLSAMGCQKSAAQQKTLELTKNNTWYQTPQLGIMTGFFYIPKSYSDYSLEEWLKGVGDEFDAAQFAKDLKDSNVDYLIFYDKWIDGFVWHDTETTEYKSERDFVKEVADACHDEDLKLMLYFNCFSDGNPEFEAWQARDVFDNPILYDKARQFGYGTVHNQKFRQLINEQVKEMLTQYGTIDGLWLDIYHERPSTNNPEIREAFKKRFGKTMDQGTSDELWELQYAAEWDYTKELKGIINKYQKECVTTYNGAMSQGISVPLALNPKPVGMDYWGWETHTSLRTDFHSWRVHFSPKALELGSKIDELWTPSMEEEPLKLDRNSINEVVMETAFALCRGGNIWLAITPGHSGKYGESLDAVKVTGDWYKKVKPYLEKSKPFSDVAVVMGTPSVDGKGFPRNNEFWDAFKLDQRDMSYEVISICEDLETAGMFPTVLYAHADYTNWPEDLSKFKALILPERVILDDTHAQVLREYVNKGGKLISFGYATYLNELGEKRARPYFYDVFSVREGYQAPGGQLIFTDELKEKYFQNLDFSTTDQTFNAILGPDADVIAHKNDRYKSPGIIRHAYGQGQSYYVTSGEAAFRGNRAFWTGMREMVIGKPSFIMKSDETIHRDIELRMRNSKINKDLNRYATILKQTQQGNVLHLIDRKALNSKVTIQLDPLVIGSFTKATLIETGENVEFKTVDGKVELTVTCNPVASILFQ